MASNWVKRRISDLGRVVTGKTPPASDPHNFGGDFPFITIPDLDGRVFITESNRYLSDRGAKIVKSSLIPPGSVMMSCIATVGRCGITSTPSFTNQQINSVIPNDSVDARFLYYVFTQMTNQLDAASGGGSVYANISKSRFSSIEVEIPEKVSEQRAIAHILGTLDDKIELNRQMSENLEEMAAALFKAWFVDFEPVKAKMEGRWKKGESLPGMPAKLYDLFPDKLVETEEGEFIPEGWEKATIMECFDVTMGQSPPGNTYNSINDGTPFYQGSTDFGFRFPSRRIYCTKPTRIARKWETLMSVRAPVGDINQAFEECAIGRGVCSVIHKEGYSSYTHYFVKNMRNIFNSYNGEGTVFGSINKNTIGTIPFSSPPKGLVLAFEEYANPIDRKIGSLFFQDSPLRSMRDVLLPKLISGELRVPDVEKLVKQSEELEARKKEIADQFKGQP